MSRKIWKKPKRPLNYDLMMDELKTLGTFGLKTKKELWKTQTELSRVRLQARSLLALRQEERERKEPILIQSLSKIGLVDQNSTLDDVLNLQVNDLLSRRLQTIAQRKLFFKTPYQARQAIVHGHIMIGDSVVTVPSYVVKTEEETKIRLIPESRFNETLSKPESDLGSPETENLESETNDQSKNEESPVKQDAEKESTEESPVKQDAEKESTEES
uniref:Ribosomal protein S4P (RP-S4, rpsD) n=1 Tax=uncultured marine thaumarchaeote AD1000_60_A11 TaxID=1455927 RepID=A0A075FVA4_9ARCH|nr:ribosomal protein S4P (RP-S4, rpsD) [uncultured marine thaumarchaeote AD1000_60_A11]